MEHAEDAIPPMPISEQVAELKAARAADVGPFLRQEGRWPVAMADAGQLTLANNVRMFPGQKYVSSPLRPGSGWVTSLMKRVGYTH